MPFPVAHSIISAGVMVAFNNGLDLRKDLRLAALFVFAGLLPDVDFITVPFMGFGGHRGLTHSFVFAAIAGTAIFGLLSLFRSGLPRRLWLFLVLVIAVHPVCDFFTYDFLVERGGVQLFYPVSLEYFESPYPIFMGIELRYLSTILTPRSIVVILYETFLASVFFFTVYFYQRLRARGMGSTLKSSGKMTEAND